MWVAGCLRWSTSDTRGRAGTTRLPSTRLLDECIAQPSPREGQVPMEAPLVSACTFYILYEACSALRFIFTLLDLRRRLCDTRWKHLELIQEFRGIHVSPQQSN